MVGPAALWRANDSLPCNTAVPATRPRPDRAPPVVAKLFLPRGSQRDAGRIIRERGGLVTHGELGADRDP